MISPAKKLIYLLFISALFCSCYSGEAGKKKHVREKWFEYFFAFTTSPNDTMRLGTKDMFVEFQNHSEYKVDSVAIDFHNYGLFVMHPDDTLHAVNIPPNGHITLPVPRHYFGVHETARIIFLRSKELEFCFKTDSKHPDPTGDAYHCQ